MTTHTLDIPVQAEAHPFTEAQLDAAAALLRHIPRDQALGLRLLALAQACAAAHMAEAVHQPTDEGVTQAELDALLGNSQAAHLIACMGGRP